MDNRHEMGLIIDGQGNIIRANEAWVRFCKKHGLAEEVWKIGSNYISYVKSCNEVTELSVVEKILNTDSWKEQQIYSFPSDSGEIQWLSVQAKPVMLGKDQNKGALLFHEPLNLHTIEPITAESILESMTDGFYLLDDSFKFVYINEIAEKNIQRKKSDVIGRDLLEVFPGVEGSNFHRKLINSLEENKVVNFEEYFETLSSWYYVKVHPLKKGGLAIYFQDISERKQTEEKLKEYAYYDHLTGLPNRRWLTRKAKSLMEQKKKFTMFFIDLDNLKFVNALHNFHVGDKVIQMIAGKLIQLPGDKCFAGRLDSDEFGIVYLPDTGERLEGFANKLKAIFEQPFKVDEFQSVPVHASIGIACYPYDSENLPELSSCAETAMYEAKKTSGTSYSFFRPKMKEERARQSKIEEGLAGNLKENGYYFTVQPQINGETGELRGVEVLSRWNHPELGEISPVEFIQIAEQAGSSGSLTYVLLKEVFGTVKKWELAYHWNIKTAINMTPSLLANPDFFDVFFNLLDSYGIRPELIEIEITEQAEMTYSGNTLKNLHRCYSKGMSIAIDDFGTGFSMLAYLTSFPIDKIKVDRYFIQRIGQDSKSEALLKSLIQLAHNIKCEILAEGVERPEEVSFLKANGCTMYQGYYFDKPMKPHDFEEKYLANRHRF